MRVEVIEVVVPVDVPVDVVVVGRQALWKQMPEPALQLEPSGLLGPEKQFSRKQMPGSLHSAVKHGIPSDFLAHEDDIVVVAVVVTVEVVVVGKQTP